MVERPDHFLLAVVGLMAVACFQETSIADIRPESIVGKAVPAVELIEAQEVTDLALFYLDAEGESVAQVEAINTGRFQPYWAGRSAKHTR